MPLSAFDVSWVPTDHADGDAGTRDEMYYTHTTVCKTVLEI